jgi:predicted P-loop ATPase
MGAVIVPVANDHASIRCASTSRSSNGTARSGWRAWLHEYLGAQASEYARAAGMKFLIGAVARVMRRAARWTTC